MAYRNGPKIVTDGLVLCLDAAGTKSYPGSGTAWYDVSGSQYHGTLINSPTFNFSNKGIINFDGTNDRCTLATTSDSEIRNITVPYTIIVWVRPYTQHTGAIVGAYSCSAGSMNIYLRVYSNSGNLKAQAFYPTSGGSFAARETGVSVTLNNWHQIAVVVSGTISAAYMKIYVDNIPSGNYSIGGLRVLNTVGWSVGAANCAGDLFNGDMSQILMYNRDFSSDEILQNYKATKGRFGL